MKKKGFSLAETLVATFILFSTLVIFAALVDTALRYYSQIEKRNQAASVADRKFEEIAEWARQPAAGGHNFEAGNWASFAGPATDAYYPDMQISVQSDLLLNVLSPDSELEQEFSPTVVNLEEKLRRIQITVDWSDATDPNRQVKVVYYLSPPLRNLPLTVQVQPSGGLPNPVPANTSVSFVARAYDADSNPVPGLTYSWEVVPTQPTPGSATIELPTRDGRAGVLTNKIYADDSVGAVPLPASRTCLLRVYTLYHGVSYEGDSGGITLAP